MVENTDEAAATGGEMQEGQAVGHREQMGERRPVRLASLGIRFFLTAALTANNQKRRGNT